MGTVLTCASAYIVLNFDNLLQSSKVSGDRLANGGRALGFGGIQNANAPRQIQLALKLFW